MTYQVGQSWDIPTLIKNCKETRFEHVQLRTTHKHGVELALSKPQRAEVKQRFADAGLAISLASAYQFHSPDQTELRRNIEGAKQFLQLAADVGALGVRVFPNAVPDEGSPDREKILEQNRQVGVRGRYSGPQPGCAASAGRAWERDVERSCDQENS